MPGSGSSSGMLSCDLVQISTDAESVVGVV